MDQAAGCLLYVAVTDVAPPVPRDGSMVLRLRQDIFGSVAYGFGKVGVTYGIRDIGKGHARVTVGFLTPGFGWVAGMASLRRSLGTSPTIFARIGFYQFSAPYGRMSAAPRTQTSVRGAGEDIALGAYRQRRDAAGEQVSQVPRPRLISESPTL